MPKPVRFGEIVFPTRKARTIKCLTPVSFNFPPSRLLEEPVSPKEHRKDCGLADDCVSAITKHYSLSGIKVCHNF